jgi:TatD DNase family protein
MTIELIDIGANLGHESFAHDLPAVLQRAREAGVVQLVVTGASREGARDALALARAHPGLLYATAGVHPHHALEVTAEGEAGAARAAGRSRKWSPTASAGWITSATFARARRSAAPSSGNWRWRRRTASRCSCTSATRTPDYMAILRQFEGKLGPCVTHCFTGTRAEMYECLDAGHSIGITGWLCDERRGTHLREIVRDIPADRLLIETDAPYLLPRTVKPAPSHRRNEPMYLRHIVEELARDRGEELAMTAATTTANARRFFGLPVAALS